MPENVSRPRVMAMLRFLRLCWLGNPASTLPTALRWSSQREETSVQSHISLFTQPPNTRQESCLVRFVAHFSGSTLSFSLSLLSLYLSLSPLRVESDKIGDTNRIGSLYTIYPFYIRVNRTRKVDACLIRGKWRRDSTRSCASRTSTQLPSRVVEEEAKTGDRRGSRRE